ncbi:hypothetical protein OQA88_6572 [Cercophora sp. LCS_1]
MPQTTNSVGATMPTNVGAAAPTSTGAVVPIYKFSNHEEFGHRHEAAVRAEYELEKKEVDSFNDKKMTFQAWIVKKGAWQMYTILADLRGMKELQPQVGQSFFFEFAVGNESYRDAFRGQRRESTMNLGENWADHVEFTVSISRTKAKNISEFYLKPLTNEKVVLPGSISPDPSRAVPIQITLRASKATMQAELGALHKLQAGNASEEGQAAFTYLMDFENPTHHVNLFDHFPQMQPSNIKLPTLRRDVQALDRDQMAAYRGLGSVANGVCFVPGGPGAGKTTWTLNMAMLAQSVDRPPKILYMIDLNKSADDAANRVQANYHKHGLDRTVIRMRSWPTVRFLNPTRPVPDATSNLDGTQTWGAVQELKTLSPDDKPVQTEPLPVDCDDDDEEDESSRYSSNKSEIEDDEAFRSMETANFTIGFLAELQANGERDPLTAPTLDRAALELYRRHRGWFGSVEDALDDATDETLTAAQHREAIEALRVALISLYHAVLTTADFIVTTPVAAKRHLTDVFKPKIVILDEAGHARELSAMIPLAFFEPKVWFFTGDHRQTDPYSAARGDDNYSCQLKISTMERAAVNGAIPYQLLLNHRARGILERLPSRMFYGGAMRSNRDDKILLPSNTSRYPFCTSQYPASTLHLLDWLRDLSGDMWFTVPRAVVHNTNLSMPVQCGTSYWNPGHHAFVMKQVKYLLQDPLFLQPSPAKAGEKARPGTIMIMSPYREAVCRYRDAIEEAIADRKDRSRVMALTIDTAQGQEADVVILDMVRLISTPHLEDAKRLCVAITRARQAELVIMSERMVRGQGKFVSTGNLRTIWQACEKVNQAGEREGVIARVAM